MNIIGPLPRPDGSYLTSDTTPLAGSTRQEAPPATTEVDSPVIDPSLAAAGRAGLDEDGFTYQLDPVDELPSAEAQAALQTLFSHPPNSPSPETPSETKKRKAGTSRINMLARGGACEFCKKRKLKCSAEEPTCSACKRMNQPCVYAQKKQRSKVRQLEDRLADLETRLRESQGGSDSGMQVSDGFDLSMADAGFTLPGDLSGWFVGDLALEQDGGETLMTLADAASGGEENNAPYAWEAKTEVEIASEIVKAVEGIEGVGKKILSHL